MVRIWEEIIPNWLEATHMFSKQFKAHSDVFGLATVLGPAAVQQLKVEPANIILPKPHTGPSACYESDMAHILSRLCPHDALLTLLQ